jgi:hypothetical protein
MPPAYESVAGSLTRSALPIRYGWSTKIRPGLALDSGTIIRSRWNACGGHDASYGRLKPGEAEANGLDQGVSHRHHGRPRRHGDGRSLWIHRGSIAPTLFDRHPCVGV